MSAKGSVQPDGQPCSYLAENICLKDKHINLQGPSLSRCAETQQGTNYCHPGCGSDVCVQPGTIPDKLREYIAKWEDGWLDRYTVNDY